MWLGAIVLFLLGGAVLVWPWASGAVTIPWDAKAQFEPQLVFLARALHTGQSPFWTPNVFAGHPQIADPQSGIFSPPFFLLAFFDAAPSFRAIDLTTFGMLALGGVALILFFRDRQWHPAGALVAAFSFAFGASAAWRIQHVGEVVSLSWFPITLWLLARALERRSFVYGLLAGITAGFMVLGRDQIALLCVYLLTGYAVWFLVAAQGFWRHFLLSLRPLVAGLIGGVGVITLPLLWTLSLAQDSNRPIIDLASAEKGSLHPASLLTGLIANLYGTDGPLKYFWGPPSPIWQKDLYLARNMSDVYIGALPAVLLFCVGLFGGALAWRGIRFFTVGFVLILLYALGRYTPVFAFMYHLPGVDLYRRTADATFPLGALAAILAGFCLHRILTAERSGLHWFGIVPGLVVIALLFWKAEHFVDVHLLHGSSQSADAMRMALNAQWSMMQALICVFIACIVLVLLLQLGLEHSWLALALIGVLMTFDLRINNGPNESTALPSVQYDVLRPDSRNDTIAWLKQHLTENAGPDRRDRMELAAVDFHWPNASLVHDLDEDLGYNPVRLKLFTDVTNAGDHIALPDQRQFSPLWPSYRGTLSDLLGLRYIVTGVPIEQIDKTLQPGEWAPVARTRDAYIYENPSALPRVLFANQVEPANFDEMLHSGKWPDVDYRHTVLLEKSGNPPPGDKPTAPGTVTLASYANTDIVVNVTSPEGGWVVLNDIWHPWWQADVDGTAAEILRANVMFRAVHVPGGSHQVHFTFHPLEGLIADWRAAL
ncbi:hypothetical protein DYH55_12245 [Methylovirgula sp. 4M-Z18]|nr:hypothetical protein DYH55_12245 [Methylovirgula sp. 4M-Z18]